MAAAKARDVLAIDGGQPVRAEPWPIRRLFGQAEKDAVAAVMDEAIAAGTIVPYSGPQEEAYCREFADSLGGGFADAVNSGTNALYVALRALEIEPFTEVVVPPITDPGGVMPVALINSIPVPADAAPGSFNAGPEQIAERLTPYTSAIVVAHIAGLPADMDPIMELARGRGLKVVEDCAQAHGAVYRGRPVGTIGDVAIFSTMSGKHHATGGQGGVIFTRDEALYWRARRYADRGKPIGLEGQATNVVASLNCNMTDLGAAIGRVQLRRLPAIVRRRREFIGRLAAACRQDLAAIRVTEELPGCQASYWFCLLNLALDKLRVGKQQFVDALAAEGLPVAADYLFSPALSDWFRNRAVFGRSGYPWASPLYRGDATRQYDVPNAVAANARHFRLAVHEDCGPRELDDTLAALAKVENAYLRENAGDH